MTHVKNAESYSRLVDICTGLGGTYNPGKQSLQVEALIAQQKEVKKAFEQVIAAKANFDTVVNERRRVFRDLKRVAVSVQRTLEACRAPSDKLDDTRALVRSIAGYSSPSRTLPPANGVEPVRRRSTLQLAFASRTDSFAQLVKAVSTEPLYLSNDPYLTVGGLNEMLKRLQILNAQVSDARVRWSNATIHRNKVMYDEQTSVARTVSLVRMYMRSIFGLQSEQFAQLKAVRFTKPGK